MNTSTFKTRIICTLGPAIASEDKLIDLIKSGANIFRLNMSHGSHKSHAETIALIRSVEQKLDVFIPIVADIQGPKLRVADLPGDGVVSLINGRNVYLADENLWKKEGMPDDVIPVRYPTIAKDVRPGDPILFNDGLMKVSVISIENNKVKALVANGGLLKSRKGINLPGVAISQPAVTAKDKRDIRFAVEHSVDYLAVSFVRTAGDVIAAKNFVKKCNGDLPIIAKIEKPEALVNIEHIIEAADGVMIARGDLGVEIPASKVPIVQKQIIRLCKINAKPVITATQMLESMVQHPRPTRAEASDVANAVLDGTDAVMLSAETSVGAYPVESVAYMRRICTEAEREWKYANYKYVTSASDDIVDVRTNAISKAVLSIVEEVKIQGIASLTYSSKTIRFISNRRPDTPIIAVTTDINVARRVHLFWGVTALVIPKLTSADQTIEVIKKSLVEHKYFPPGSDVVITIGRPLRLHARTNMISIERLE